MTTHIARLTGTVLVAALASGCASRGKLEVGTAPASPLNGYSSVLINVTSQVKGATREVVDLESTLAAMLREQKIFERVTTASAAPDAAADLRLEATIVKAKKVSAGQRAFLGAFAGRAGMVVEVVLIDARSNNRLAQVKAEGQSSGGTVLAGTTDQAIQRVSEQIVKFVQSNRTT